MKKVKALSISMLALMVMAISMFALAGCGEPASVEGTWNIDKMEMNGEDYLAQMKQLAGSGVDAKIEFADGKATIKLGIMGQTQTQSLGSYTVENGVVKFDGGVEGKISGNHMTISDNGQTDNLIELTKE